MPNRPTASTWSSSTWSSRSSTVLAIFPGMPISPAHSAQGHFQRSSSKSYADWCPSAHWIVSSRRARSARISSGRSRSAGSLVSRLALGGFVVSGSEDEIEILPVGHPAQLGELQHHAALRLEDGVMDRVEVLGIDPPQPIRQFGVVPRREGHDLLPDILRKETLVAQPELLQPIEERVPRRAPPVGEPHPRARQLRP